MRHPARHWEPPRPIASKGLKYGAFCTRRDLPMTTKDKEKVTCRNCLRLMKLHGHLPEEEEAPYGINPQD